jgi:hypothetical protein
LAVVVVVVILRLLLLTFILSRNVPPGSPLLGRRLSKMDSVLSSRK